MNLELMAVALEARSDLKAILKCAEVAKKNLFNSDLDDGCYTMTYNQIESIIEGAKKAIRSIDLEHDKAQKVLA